MTFQRIGITVTILALLCIVAGLPFGLAGCAQNPFMQPGPESTNVMGAANIADAVQRSINEANIDITAAARVLNQNSRAGIIEPSKAAGIRQTLREAAQTVDQAQEILRLGDPEAASQNLALAQSIVLSIRREIEQQSKKEKAK